MENKFITVDDLKAEVAEELKGATVADLKWMYCYFKDFEEFPLVVDEPAAKRTWPHMELAEELIPD